ncbi:sugar isomerase (SIS) family protein [Actinidia rufa]|uniref:Sugar isomerase (SIS) family protein n=1 Tax=Actinidia rufa TaxID=165716 RepID=A0A7J0G592_9ERIC|nr:sugar isomerase (SIS) family protein [Actinidia rufa]
MLFAPLAMVWTIRSGFLLEEKLEKDSYFDVSLTIRGVKRVKDVMKKQEELPVCKEGDLIMDQLVELTSKGCGCLLVINDQYQLIGTFTDGDLRRTLKASGEGIFKLTVGQMCNRNPRTISPDAMAVEAMQKMESPPSPVQFLPVIDQQNIFNRYCYAARVGLRWLMNFFVYVDDSFCCCEIC